MSAYKVLVIEDSALNRELLEDVFKRSGFQITACSTAEEGLALLSRLRPDAVLMDVSLPGMDGLTAIRRIRRGRELPKVVIVALTAHASPSDRELGMSIGCDAYIAKPYDVRSLVDEVCRLIDHRRGRGTSPTA